eukprot:m.184855 g.184855  ORF g.184855 m.184855 type:complete len:1036 (-) comp10512_c0_seq3:176-3283(-)
MAMIRRAISQPTNEITGLDDISYKALYYGSVKVEHAESDELVNRAAGIVHHARPQRVFLIISGGFLKVIDRRSGDILQNADLEDILFFSIFSHHGVGYVSRHRSAFYCHIVKAKHHAKDFCHSITKYQQSPVRIVEAVAAKPVKKRSPDKSKSSISRIARRFSRRPGGSFAKTTSETDDVAGQAAEVASTKMELGPRRGSAPDLGRSAELPVSPTPSLESPSPNQFRHHRRRSSTSSHKPSLSALMESDDEDSVFEDDSRQPAISRVFGGWYLGSEAVSGSEGEHLVHHAAYKNMLYLSRIQDIYSSAESMDGEPVKIFISSELVRTITTDHDKSEYDEVASTLVKNVTYSCIAHSNPHRDIFAYIAFNERLGTKTCHIYRMPPGGGRDILLAVEDAQKAWEARNSNVENPFGVVDAARPSIMPPNLMQWQLQREDLEPLRILGGGQFGQVYLAHQRLRHRDGLVERAVKVLRDTATRKDEDNFVEEALTMSKLNHPNLVTFVGVVLQKKPWLAVLEYMDYGDLRTVLQACTNKSIELTLSEKLHWCFQISQACGFLANKHLVHMDIAARNCMLGLNGVVKLGDFGLTRPFDEGQLSVTLKDPHVRLPLKWVSIEGIEQHIFSEASDVWSFGVTMWEIFSKGETPYRLVRTQNIPERVREGLRLPIPEDCPMPVFMLMYSCWKQDPTERPSFSALIRSIHQELRKSGLPEHWRDIGRLVASATRRISTRHFPSMTSNQGVVDPELEKYAVLRVCPLCSMVIQHLDMTEKKIHVDFCNQEAALGMLAPVKGEKMPRPYSADFADLTKLELGSTNATPIVPHRSATLQAIHHDDDEGDEVQPTILDIPMARRISSSSIKSHDSGSASITGNSPSPNPSGGGPDAEEDEDTLYQDYNFGSYGFSTPEMPQANDPLYDQPLQGIASPAQAVPTKGMVAQRLQELRDSYIGSEASSAPSSRPTSHAYVKVSDESEDEDDNQRPEQPPPLPAREHPPVEILDRAAVAATTTIHHSEEDTGDENDDSTSFVFGFGALWTGED